MSCTYERDPFMEFEHAGMQVRIEYDDVDYDGPRDWDNLGVMLFWHNRMNLGDDTATIEKAGLTKADPDYYGGWEELLRGCGVTDRDVVVPVFAYEHGGITIRAGGYSLYWPDIRWDAGQLGFIVCPYDRIRSEYSVKRVSKQMRERIASYLSAEVETYDDFLNGNVYGYRVIDPDTEYEEACWGFYPDHSLPYDRENEYVISEAKAVAEGMAADKVKNAGWVAI